MWADKSYCSHISFHYLSLRILHSSPPKQASRSMYTYLLSLKVRYNLWRWKHKIRIGGPNRFQLLKLLQKHLEKRFPFPHRYPTATRRVGATCPLRSFIPLALNLWLYPVRRTTDWPPSPPFHCQSVIIESTKATFIIKQLLIPPSNSPPFFPKVTDLRMYHFNMSLTHQVIIFRLYVP